MHSGSHHHSQSLLKYLWLSVATAIVTLTIKLVAALLTNSVGLWSDALESTVNLAAALIAIWAMIVAARPADSDHDFGHGKAEYLSAAAEGLMIFVAAVGIIYSAVQRFLYPSELENLSWGLLLSLSASIFNLGTGWYLIRVGKRERSITLEADGRHLMTDVITSAGVLAAMLLVMLSGWVWLDPVIAILVGLNILITGIRLLRRSFVGLLDAALPPEDVAQLTAALDQLASEQQVALTSLRTRESGRQRFVYVTLEVPGDWSVRRSHDVADLVEDRVAETLEDATTYVHIEPAQ
ncbi:MAG: cation diffusion facilitator family transporter [Propionibacteriaceae bacterium]|jgi:cation diffusion facilitator family transporter|nr:cation diffusion facilitator family transporter [Propionibacteriaceae bacterium]